MAFEWGLEGCVSEDWRVDIPCRSRLLAKLAMRTAHGVLKTGIRWGGDGAHEEVGKEVSLER